MSDDITHDLDLLDDWLAGNGYGEEAGLVLRALSLIHKLQDGVRSTIQERDVLSGENFDLRAENEKLREENWEHIARGYALVGMLPDETLVGEIQDARRIIGGIVDNLRAENEKLRAENNEAYAFGLHKGKEAAFIDYGIERLRAENEKLHGQATMNGRLLTENAELREQNEKLRAALKPFAELAEYYDVEPDAQPAWDRDFQPTVGELRAAAAALNDMKSDKS